MSQLNELQMCTLIFTVTRGLVVLLVNPPECREWHGAHGTS